MSDNKGWQGGPNFVLQSKTGRGSNNSGNGSASNPALTKRGRFNGNPTRRSGGGCMIAAAAQRQKETACNLARPVLVKRSGVTKQIAGRKPSPFVVL